MERSVVLGPCEIRSSSLSGCVVDEGARLIGVKLRNALVPLTPELRGQTNSCGKSLEVCQQGLRLDRR